MNNPQSDPPFLPVDGTRVLRVIQWWTGVSGQSTTWEQARDIAATSVPLDRLFAALTASYNQYKPSTLAYFRRQALDMDSEHHKRIDQKRAEQKGSAGFVLPAAVMPSLLPALPLDARTGRSRPAGRSDRGSPPATTSPQHE